MSDEPEDFQGEDPDELRREIQERGARAAYRALLEVCENPKSPAPARATAGVAILRAAGFFESAESKPKDGMSRFSLKELERLRDSLQRHDDASGGKDARGAQAGPSGEDLFG